MNIPDNYTMYQIEERRMYEVEYICCMCEAGFTDDEMSEDLNYCQSCYTELEEFEEISNQDIADLINAHTGLNLTADDVYDNMYRYNLIRIVPTDELTDEDRTLYGVIGYDDTTFIVFEI